MITKAETLIEKIKNERLDETVLFEIAKIANVLLSSGNSKFPEVGRKLIIYILDNWWKIPDGYKELYTDLIARCGFYPYLEKEKNNLLLNDLRSEIKKEFHRSPYIKLNDGDDLFFHEKQKEISEILLNSDRNLVVSAPTSFGKSLLIEEIVASKRYTNIVIIQPTLALLNETRNNLRKYEDSYKIIVRVADKPSLTKGNLFLLTAERVMEYQDFPEIQFFILDEFYKISQKRDDERFEVLNNACNKMLNIKKSRFYFLGPNIDKISSEFSNKYNAIFKKYDYSLVINEEKEPLTNEENKIFSDRTVAPKEQKLFEELLKLGEQTIIYCSSPDKSTRTAINFAKFLESQHVQGKNTEENIPLIQWITENLSYKWDVILCLKNKIGLHNGAFPKHINSSIIDYFNNGQLKYLFCTSTIIEGVNTSTKNVVIYNNWKGKQNKKIDYFDYKNIKGRSGRMFKHYIGNLYSFYPKFEEEEIEIDVPFVDQLKPLNKEILAQTPENDIKDKNSKEYQELKALPQEELELFKKNGLGIDGQKAILEHLKSNFKTDYPLFCWTNKPKWTQSEYILNLCFEHLTKETETGGGITPKKLATLINICNFNNNLFSIIANEIKYQHEQLGKDFNTALISGFQIQRHWFDYKLPKWFGAFNELQKYVCKINNVPAGDYSFFLAILENDYMSPRANLLMEFDLPKTAIRKLDEHIPKTVEEEYLLNYIKENYLALKEKSLLSKYESERIEKEVL